MPDGADRGLDTRPGPPLGRGHPRWHPGPLGRRRCCGPFRRAATDRLLGGVAAGIARRRGWDVTVVRLGFVLATLAGGFGIGLYMLGWLLVPAEDESSNIASRALSDRRGLALAAAVASLVGVLLALASALGAGWLGSMAWALLLGAAGVVLIWRNGSIAERAMFGRATELIFQFNAVGRRRLLAPVRLLVGIVLLAAGLVALLHRHPAHSVLGPLGGVALVLAAVVLVLGPWWLRIARDLVFERQARARAEERADMAARLHDSVLQTLALIQRRADQPQQVIRLARAQERELRSWLFDPHRPDTGTPTVSAGIRAIQQQVEEQHGITVEAVTVGDCVLDEGLEALLAAAREATVNAAKWSGASSVSVFAEVDAATVAVFVRDRGRGFDPEAVPADRKGLAESVHGRMTRHGGTATVASVVGEGTEVSLQMPRTASERTRVRRG